MEYEKILDYKSYFEGAHSIENKFLLNERRQYYVFNYKSNDPC